MLRTDNGVPAHTVAAGNAKISSPDMQADPDDVMPVAARFEAELRFDLPFSGLFAACCILYDCPFVNIAWQ